MDWRFALLLACFFLSGFAALLYQTAWTRELSFVFGTSELAVAAVLAAYMGGLALGAAAAERFGMRLRRPVLAYGILEMAIAVSALCVPLGIRGIDALYVALLGSGNELPPAASTAAALIQLAGASLVLLPPTIFMGATLPLLARHAVRRESEIASRIGSLYAVNTAGAIAGTLCAAFWLMPELGLRRTVWSGAALNVLVFGLAALLSQNAPFHRNDASPARVPLRVGRAAWILPAIALSGAVSFAYEVLWTRLLGQMLGASVHAFATMLASFLLGIALGSAVAARLAATRERAVLGFSVAQLGIALTSYAAFIFADWLPALSQRLGAGMGSTLPSAAVAVIALLPITFCIGATFPFAVRVLAAEPEHAAAATARVYSWNTIGAIAGALGAGFLLLPWLGFEGTLNLGVVISLVLCAVAALAAPRRNVVLVGLALLCGVALAWRPALPPWTLLTTTSMRVGHTMAGEILHFAVGRSATVMMVDQGVTFRLFSNGLPESAIESEGLLPQLNIAQWLGALPALLRPEARSLLVVGFGGGVALELVPSSIESIDVIELEPEVLVANQRVAGVRARDPLADPRVKVHIGDARGSLQLTQKDYDAIISQPSHPWTAGASHLYTREFFSQVRSHLNQDGVFVQWIGINFIDTDLLRSLLSTLRAVFPHVELYRPYLGGLLFVGSNAPIAGLAGADRALRLMPADLSRLGLHRLEDFAAAWALDEQGVQAIANAAPLTTDDHNLLAARSPGLGDRSLSLEQAHKLFGKHDPLRSSAGLDGPALIRRLAAIGDSERATDLALASEGAQKEIGLGWIEMAAARNARARRHFERALEMAPGEREALAGIALCRKLDLSRGKEQPELSVATQDVALATLIRGWQSQSRSDWSELAALDAELARIEPGDPLFDEATRLRIQQRLATGGSQAGAEAQSLAEILLLQAWRPYEALLHARAAIQAGQPIVARASLQVIAERIPRDAKGRAFAERALDVAKDLPEEMADSLRTQLSKLSSGAAGSSVRTKDGVTAQPDRRGTP